MREPSREEIIALIHLQANRIRKEYELEKNDEARVELSRQYAVLERAISDIRAKSEGEGGPTLGQHVDDILHASGKVETHSSHSRVMKIELAADWVNIVTACCVVFLIVLIAALLRPSSIGAGTSELLPTEQQSDDPISYMNQPSDYISPDNGVKNINHDYRGPEAKTKAEELWDSYEHDGINSSVTLGTELELEVWREGLKRSYEQFERTGDPYLRPDRD